MAVHRTRSVAESVVTLSAVRVDLILIDLLVPPPDATTLLRILRANPDFSTIPVIALAAPGDVSRVPLARRLGVQEVLIKPISTSHLLQTLRRCLGLAPGVGPETETPTMPLRFGRTPRILVAEDNLVNQQVAEQHLRALGAQVVLAADGQEAVERVQEQAFDLIFMDCHMPRMDGFEATRAIRAFSDLPIVALTAAAMAGDRERCLSAGMDDHIGKPLRRASLEAALRRWLPGVG
jgi:two-component system sensor histidine kinase/response regulator